MTHREVEDTVDVHGRDVLRLLLQGQFTLRGLRVATAPVIGADGIERTHVRERGRRLETIFGEVEVERLCHGQRRVDSLAVVDSELSLPTELYSLDLRRRVASEAATVSFDERRGVDQVGNGCRHSQASCRTTGNAGGAGHATIL